MTAESCDSCSICSERLGSLCRVVPMSLYVKPSEMRERLHGYKHSGDPPTRERYSREVAGLIERFFGQHRAHLSDVLGPWDAVCVVPSTEREPPHPLVQALEDHGAESCGPVRRLLRRGSGQIAHRRPSRRAFEPAARVAGLRVLLLDDVFTTGARSQSAAYTLATASADVVAIVVVARRINPGWRPEIGEWWQRRLATTFSWAALPCT